MMSKYREYSGSRHKEYPGFTLYPFYHRSQLMPWGAASVIPLDNGRKLIFLAGATGRDPDTDRQPKNLDEESKHVGRVVGGIKEQTIAAWTRIKEILEETGANLEDIMFVHTYMVNRNDYFDMVEARKQFFKEHCVDLMENPRPGTLLKGIQLSLPDMLVEIEVMAVTGPK